MTARDEACCSSDMWAKLVMLVRDAGSNMCFNIRSSAHAYLVFYMLLAGRAKGQHLTCVSLWRAARYTTGGGRWLGFALGRSAACGYSIADSFLYSITLHELARYVFAWCAMC